MSYGVMASHIIAHKSPTTGLFCFQKFVHDNPQAAGLIRLHMPGVKKSRV